MEFSSIIHFYYPNIPLTKVSYIELEAKIYSCYGQKVIICRHHFNLINKITLLMSHKIFIFISKLSECVVITAVVLLADHWWA